MIWEAALDVPRNVHLKLKPLRKSQSEIEQEEGISTCQYAWKSENDGHRFNTWPEDTVKNYNLIQARELAAHYELRLGCCPASQPAIPFVCRESSKAALNARFYVRAFKTSDSVPETYFNFGLDTLYLCYDDIGLAFDAIWADTADASAHTLVTDLEGWVDLADFQKVQNLAILVDETVFDPSRYSERWIAFLLNTFLGVKNLAIVLKDHSKPVGGYSEIGFMDPIDLLAHRET